MKRTIYSYINHVIIVTAVAICPAAWADDKDSDVTTSATPPAATSTSSSSTLDSKASSFIREAAMGNKMEIEMAKLGLSKAQNAELKTFCEHLQRDHQQAQTKLKSLAQQHGVTLDEQKDTKAEKEMAKLEGLSGAEFDKQFAIHALKDHQKDIAKYQKASQQIQNAAVKEYAQETLPKLRHHLEHAAQVAKTVGVDQATISTYTSKSADALGGSDDTGEQTDELSGSNKEAGAKKLKGDDAEPVKESDSYPVR